MKIRVATTLIAAAVATAGCAQGVDGTPPPSFPTTTKALGDRLQSAANSLHSAHLTMRVEAGATINANGDEQLSNGKASALDLTEQLPSFGTIEIVMVNQKTYARLPESQRTSGKPWVLVRPGSSNPVVSAMGQTLQASDQFTQVGALGTFVNSTKNLRFAGIDTIDGATVGHYHLTIDVDNLPDDFPEKQTLETVGLHSLPIDAWVDTSGRSRKVTENLSVAGQKISVVVTLGNFDAPVHITAPPANEVDTS